MSEIEALRRSEEFLRLSQKVGRIGSYESWPTTGRAWWSDELYGILGVRLGTFDGRVDTFIRLIHTEDRAKALESVPALREGRQQALEYRIVRPDGAVRFVRTESIVLPGPDGVLRVVGTMQDMTEQREATAALDEAQTLVGRLVDQSLVGISIVQDGRLVFVNPKMSQLSGYTHDELLAMLTPEATLRAGVPDGDQAAIENAMRARLEDGVDEVRYATWIRHKDGRLVRLEVHGGQMQYHGRPALISAILDITERTRLEEQMLQMQKMELVGRLAGGIAHDFNNILPVVKGHCELLGHTLGTDRVQHRHVAAIDEAVDRAAALTQQLLSFGRRQLVQPTLVDLSQMVAPLQSLFVRLVGEHVETVVSLAPDLGAIRADPAQLEQVTLNLVLNARDAMPTGGTLRIATARAHVDAETARRCLDLHPGSHVTLTVEDTGSGMDEATRSRLFEPFFTTKAVGQGIGLGLSTVHDIVAQSGGAITVDTEVGRGTSFTIYFPAVDGAPAPVAAREQPAPAPRGGETVLVVDDEAPIRTLLELTLGALGYRVLIAASGRDAMRLLAEHGGPIDLLVTDVVLPQMSGDVLARQVAQRYPAVRVLFMSGYGDELLSRQGTLDPGVALLRKPFVPADLAQKIRHILDDR